MSSEEVLAEYNDIIKKYQRELNRLQDNDRNTRKRGIIKLYEDIPWDSTIKALDNTEVQPNVGVLALKNFILDQFVVNQLLCSIIVNDSIEKCRENAIKMLEKSIIICDINFFTWGANEAVRKLDIILSTTQKLCQRIGTTADIAAGASFPEPSEELRHQILNVIILLVKGKKGDVLERYNNEVEFNHSIGSAIVQSLTKSLLDPFPDVKRDGADLLCLMAILSPQTVRLHFKSLLKGLCSNSLHQHSKTRTITLKALGLCIACASEEYEASMKDHLIPLLSRFTSDRIASTRKELCDLCLHVLQSRIRCHPLSLIKEDLKLLAMLILMTTDETEVVANQAKSNLSTVSLFWKTETEKPTAISGDPMDIEDGELSLKQTIKISDVHISSQSIVEHYLSTLVDILLEGVENWTVDVKRLYLSGLEAFIHLVKEGINSVLPQLFAYLGPPIRDEESVIRLAAEKCCVALGIYIPCQDALDLLLPKIQGDVSGADTSSHRTNAIRLLTHVIQGFSKGNLLDNDQVNVAESVAFSFSKPSLYDYRELAFREAVLLNIRSLIDSFPISCKRTTVSKKLVLGLVYLQGKLSTDDDSSVVYEASKRELCRLAALNDTMVESSASSASIISEINQICLKYDGGLYPTAKLLGEHFDVLLEAIAPTSLGVPKWSNFDVSKAAFEALVRESPRNSWVHHSRVIIIIVENVQPKAAPASGSYEANMQSYASMRGEEIIPTTAEVDVRLALLALLEGLIRSGSKDWECGRYMSEAADLIIRRGLIPNLIWKAGRVEATIRKVCLAACYAILKAGSVKAETLYSTAQEFVPLLVSHLDDSDVSPRHLASLCLTVVFERLRGAFGEQAVYEMYPKILKRLDDSNDEVRLAICSTLIMFLRCAPKHCYSSTTVEYMLDQYFVHLDDTDPNIQEAVYQVIVEILNINPDAVLKKAESSLVSNRSQQAVERVIATAKAFRL